MSLSVSKRMAAIKPSPTGAVLALATELRAAGRDVISLGAGEPDFDTPNHIRQAAHAAIDAGDTRYTPVDGTAELKTAIQQKFLRENQLDYEISQILVSSGAKQCLFNLCLAVLGPGDEAVIPAPYWVSYPDMVRLAGAQPVILSAGIEEDFKITPEQLNAALSNRTRLLIMNSPSNPTGASYSERELQALGAVLERYPDVLIVADDIYEHIHWAKQPFVSFAAACPALFERTVTTNGVSKAYAMTGWRIGYAAGPHSIISAMKTIQSQSTSNPCSVSQKAAVVALSGDQSCVVRMTAAYKKRHDYIVAALNEIEGIECRPGEGTFYAFPRVTGILEKIGLGSDTDLVEHLLNAADLACVPGSAFGAAGYIRLSFACSMETLEESINRIKRAVSA
ncbi:MAG: pyridoxal phosphate-dependent aminotransferase [Gammaproteobacteria bacterium]|nr:pyridoxal phosphate-dependent aminotransferase [Gammaproteobacteria bacterium]